MLKDPKEIAKTLLIFAAVGALAVAFGVVFTRLQGQAARKVGL